MHQRHPHTCFEACLRCYQACLGQYDALRLEERFDGGMTEALANKWQAYRAETFSAHDGLRRNPAHLLTLPADGRARPWGLWYPHVAGNLAHSLRLGMVVLLTLSLSAFSSAGVTARDGTGDKGSDLADKVIITCPSESSRIYTLLSRLLGKAQYEKLAVTQSAVWSVPQSRLEHLSQRLKQHGCKITHLRDGWNYILKRHQGPVVMSPTQEEILKQARASQEIVGIRVMNAPEAAIAEYALTVGANMPTTADSSPPKATVSRIVIPINDTEQVVVQRVQAVTTAKGSSWRGTIEGTGESALLMWWKGGHISGVFPHKGHIYTIVNVGGDVHAVVETDPKKMPPDHDPTSADNAYARYDRGAARPETASVSPGSPPAGIKPFSDAERRALEAKKITIDLMILYTKKAASRYIGSPAALIELAVEQTNETFRNSGIGNVSLRLVHTQLIDYDETGAHQFDHLYRMVDGIGTFKHIGRLRNKKRADIVGLILEDPSGCGLATRVGADAKEAYFVVHHSCAVVSISIAHEIGHIFGARHDRTTDASNSPFAYGRGHVNGSKWRDIMSYHKGCDGCPRIPFWSNPRIMYQGEPTGTLAEDNARVILEQAERVSKFR